jgi:hypothetical protein
MFSRLFVLAACFSITACATSYQSASLTGGHFEAKGPGKLEQVTFSANGYTSFAVTEKYAIYRAAEVAKSKGKNYFVMYDSLYNAARDIPSFRPRLGWVQNKPVATSYVLLLDTPRRGAQPTDKVLEELKDVIATGKITAS